MKTTLLWILALFMLAAPGAAEAITVSITATRPGVAPVTVNLPTTNHFNDSAGNRAMSLACPSAPVAATPVCTRTIQVGTTTVTIRDISTTNRARVYRVDGLSSDILNLAGLLATSGAGITATSGVTLKITYASDIQTQTTPNEYAALTGNLYAYTAAMSGTFLKSTPAGAPASACASTIATPPHCLTLKLLANNVTVNQFGDNAVATVNVHNLTTGGAFGPPTHPSETKSIPCGTIGLASSCKPSLQGELTAIYKGPTETLRVVGGAAVGGSNNPITEGGVKDTAVDVSAPEGAVNDFVGYTQEPTLHATLVQAGGRFPNLQQGANLPLWWNLDKVVFPPPPLNPNLATLLRSIVNNADLFDDGAYVTWVPTQGQVQARDLTSLVADFDWGVTSTCSNSLFVEIELTTVDTTLNTFQKIKIPLRCDLSSLSGLDLVTVGGPIVQLPNNSFTTWKSMLTQFGGIDIRAISVRLTKTTVNQEVALNSFTIGAFKTTFEHAGGRAPVLPYPDLFCDFPGLNEFTMRVTPLDADNNPVVENSFIWGDGPGETFSKTEHTPGDCQLRTEIPVTSFPAHDRESGWRFELLYNLVPVDQPGDVSLF